MKANNDLLAVIDTNIWLSAMLSRSGAPALIVKRLLIYGRPVLTTSTYDELEQKIWLSKFDRYLSMELRKQLLHDISAIALWVNIPNDVSQQRFSRDQDDDKFIHAALIAKAPWIITGDQDLLVLKDDLQKLNTTVLTANQALDLQDFGNHQ